MRSMRRRRRWCSKKCCWTVFRDLSLAVRRRWPDRIPPGGHRIELRYTGLSFNAPERIRFRYRLEGLDPDWVEAGTRRTAFYSYVPPGNYRFRVVACNGNGVWNETGASLPLTV